MYAIRSYYDFDLSCLVNSLFQIQEIPATRKKTINGLLVFAEIGNIISEMPMVLCRPITKVTQNFTAHAIGRKDIFLVRITSYNVCYTKLLRVMKQLDNNKIRHLPIMDEGKLVGMVSIGDVVNELLQINLFENEQLKNYIISPY